MSRIGQPVNQVRLTNVAVVRMKVHGQRFEIACYKNKVVNWRNRVETDLDEVLQAQTVFENVSKGIHAKNTDLQEAFETTNQKEICLLILEKGELQVSDKERSHATASLYRDIATIVADKCVNPESNRPYPFSVIESAMKDMHFSPVPNRNAKQQALEVIKKLKKLMPIARARMKVQIIVPMKDGKKFKEMIEKIESCEVLEQQWDASATFTCLMDPGIYRSIDAMVQAESKGAGSLEVIELNCQQEGDFSIDDEMMQKETRIGTISSGATNAGHNRSTVPVSVPAKEMADASEAKTTGREKEGEGLRCTTCGGDFGSDKQLYRNHFKSDWHRYNLKRKAKKHPVVDEATFNEISVDELNEFFKTL